MRVLLDTNLFISYLLLPEGETPVPRIVRAALAGTFTLLVTDQLLAEMAGALARKPYLAARISAERGRAFLNLLDTIAERVPLPESPLPVISRDPKDNYLLSTAIAGQADYLVTGDADLLTLVGMVPVAIISPSAFVRVLESSGG